MKGVKSVKGPEGMPAIFLVLLRKASAQRRKIMPTYSQNCRKKLIKRMTLLLYDPY